MNREQAKKILPVIQAFADGKEIHTDYLFADGTPFGIKEDGTKTE